MRDWSDLLLDPLGIVARKLNKIEDFTAFRSTCTSWREAANKVNFTGLCLWQNMPYLMMLKDESDQDEREFYSLLKKRIAAKVSLPEAKGKICFASQGWLLTIGELGDMSLLNPFSSGSEIQLGNIKAMPDYGWVETEPYKFIQKMILWSNSSDFVIMVIYGYCQNLSFWKFGDRAWGRIEAFGAFKDIACHRGQFFGITAKGSVWGCNIFGPNPTEAEFITRIPHERELQSYIMESSSGKLLIVAWPGVQFVFGEGGFNEWTLRNPVFELFEVDLVTKTWKKIKDLGGNAAFIGYSSSILVEASKFPGVKANHVYYAGCGLSTKDGPKFVCIYNLDDGSLESLDEASSSDPLNRSFWFTPNF